MPAVRDERVSWSHSSLVHQTRTPRRPSSRDGEHGNADQHGDAHAARHDIRQFRRVARRRAARPVANRGGCTKAWRRVSKRQHADHEVERQQHGQRDMRLLRDGAVDLRHRQRDEKRHGHRASSSAPPCRPRAPPCPAPRTIAAPPFCERKASHTNARRDRPLPSDDAERPLSASCGVSMRDQRPGTGCATG